jgi:uncharacterized protein YecT (DUF1311 family)
VAGLRVASIALAGLLAVSPVAAQDWNCNDMGNLPQQGINFCLAQQFHGLEAQMEAAYADVLARLPEEDEVNMRAGHLAWITYRQMMCDVEAGMMRGGSGEPMLRGACMVRITEQRLQELQEVWR